MYGIVAFLVVLAVANCQQKTHKDVMDCMTASHSSCKNQCLRFITDSNVSQKIQACMTQAEPMMTQMEATMKTCVTNLIPNIDSKPCSIIPMDNKGTGIDESQVPLVIRGLHNCSMICMTASLNQCLSGCSPTPDQAVVNAIRQCKPAMPLVGSPNGPSSNPMATVNQQQQQVANGQFDVKKCMLNAANGI